MHMVSKPNHWIKYNYYTVSFFLFFSLASILHLSLSFLQCLNKPTKSNKWCFLTFFALSSLKKCVISSFVWKTMKNMLNQKTLVIWQIIKLKYNDNGFAILKHKRTTYFTMNILKSSDGLPYYSFYPLLKSQFVYQMWRIPIPSLYLTYPHPPLTTTTTSVNVSILFSGDICMMANNPPQRNPMFRGVQRTWC